MARYFDYNPSAGNSQYEFQEKILGRSGAFYANTATPFYTNQLLFQVAISDIAKSGNNVTITVPSYTSAQLTVGSLVKIESDDANDGTFVVTGKTNTTVVFVNPNGVVDASPNAKVTHYPFIGGFAVQCLEDGEAAITEQDAFGAAHGTETMSAGDIRYYATLTSFVPTSGKFKIFLV